eukprot:gene30026-17920_t
MLTQPKSTSESVTFFDTLFSVSTHHFTSPPAISRTFTIARHLVALLLSHSISTSQTLPKASPVPAAEGHGGPASRGGKAKPSSHAGAEKPSQAKPRRGGKSKPSRLTGAEKSSQAKPHRVGNAKPSQAKQSSSPSRPLFPSGLSVIDHFEEPAMSQYLQRNIEKIKPGYSVVDDDMREGFWVKIKKEVEPGVYVGMRSCQSLPQALQQFYMQRAVTVTSKACRILYLSTSRPRSCQTMGKGICTASICPAG